MLTHTAVRRAYREIIDAASSGEDPLAARLHIVETLQGTLGFDQWSWAVADPESGLGIAGIGLHDYWGDLRQLLLAEQQVSPATSSTGNRDEGWGLSFRRELEPRGLVDEIRHEIRDAHGAWGSLDIVRSDGRTPFTDRDRELMQRVAPALVKVARSSVCGRPSPELPRLQRGAGTLLIDQNLGIRAATARAGEWLQEISTPTSGQPPLAGLAPVLNVASRAWARRKCFSPWGPARVRIRTRTDNWLVIEAEEFEESAVDVVAVTLAEARPQQVLDLRLQAHDLSPREEQLVRLLLKGRDTKFLATTLGISAYTVQDHLKSIFAKVGVENRKQLIAYLGGEFA